VDAAAPKLFVSATCDRLARAIDSVIDLGEDPRTFEMWARVPNVTEDALHRWCKLLQLDGRDVLTFARILRAVVLVESQGVGFAEILDVADPKTLRRMLPRAGFSPDRAPSSVRLSEFLAQQTLLTHVGLLNRVVALVSQRNGSEAAG
jgi:hypothetical protein